jgi:hypothetical protein
MGPRNRVGIGLSYWPARLHKLAESIPGLFKVLKYRLSICFVADPDSNIFVKMPDNKTIFFFTMIAQKLSRNLEDVQKIYVSPIYVLIFE